MKFKFLDQVVVNHDFWLGHSGVVIDIDAAGDNRDLRSPLTKYLVRFDNFVSTEKWFTAMVLEPRTTENSR
jgi:hypothetical protein